MNEGLQFLSRKSRDKADPFDRLLFQDPDEVRYIRRGPRCRQLPVIRDKIIADNEQRDLRFVLEDFRKDRMSFFDILRDLRVGR